MFRQIFSVSVVHLFCILLLALLFWKLRSSSSLLGHRRRFFAVLLSSQLLCLSDLLWSLQNQGLWHLPPAGVWAMNAAYSLISGTAAFLWCVYAAGKLNSPAVRTRRRMLLCALPLAALAVLIGVSWRTGWVLSVDAAGVYHRGPLYVLELLLTYGYMLVPTAGALFRLFRTKNDSQRAEYRILAAVAVPTIAAGALQFFRPELPLVCAGNVLGLLFLYINLQEQRISVDALTGLNNRSHLLQFVNSRMVRRPGGGQTYFLMMDVDHFKQINDRFGHPEGDRALQTVAAALKAGCREQRCFLARYGGDEFALLCDTDGQEGLDALCRKIHGTLADMSAGRPYRLLVSIGAAPWDPAYESAQEWIRTADARLYEAKKNRAPALEENPIGEDSTD